MMRGFIVVSIAVVMIGSWPLPPVRAQQPPDADPIMDDLNRHVQSINDDITRLRDRVGNSNLLPLPTAEITEQRAEIRRRAGALWRLTGSKVNAVLAQARQEILKFNAENRRLDFESTVIGSRIDLFNNLGNYPTRAKFDENKDRMTAEWRQNYGARLNAFGPDFDPQREVIFDHVLREYGLDLTREGFQRNGMINPYTDAVSSQYFGTDGKLLPDQWQNDADRWNRYRRNVMAFREQQRTRKAGLERDVSKLNRLRDQIERAKRDVGAKIEALDNLR
jgi:hypothetical protein